MGRRKIEIKAIKDDRNRSVTFLKRKGGLFKKAHELSVLCSVDVAVFIFGSNKKLYEYSSGDMRDLITRYTYHGGPNEHKGPSDFNGGADDGSEDEEGTPPQPEVMDQAMMPPQFQGQPPFQHLRHHTPSASPPIPNGMVFAQHAAPRGHTPQPQMGSRPGSRNDMHRMVQPGGPPAPPQGPPVNGFAYMPQPAIYNPQNPPSVPHGIPQPGPQYPYPPPQAQPPHMQQYMEEQRRSMPPSFPPQAHPQGGPPQPPQLARHSASPPQIHVQQLPQQPIPHSSPPQPQQQQIPSPPVPQIREPPAPAPVEPKTDMVPQRPPQPPLLTTDVKKLPQRKQHSIFTPIDENRSSLAQHLAAFHDHEASKGDAGANRSQSVDVGSVTRNNTTTTSPPLPKRADTAQTIPKPRTTMASIPETTFTPPSRQNSLRVGGAARPRLRVEIPDEPSDGAASATAESSSPRGTSTDATSQTTRRNTDSHSSSMVLPPPSPSATTLLSAGATGPPNPFARPPPHQSSNMNIDTPVSALPSRFLNNEFLPSPSSFYPEWNFRGSDSNTLPSPLNFATPVVGTGPSFLRDDNNAAVPTPSNTNKRKSPDVTASEPASDPLEPGNEAKRAKVDA
ncbi:uncharacterized protein E0L32_010130 [Thyridium curvatum]|uniref:MADS-box MEF2 type transcription factor MIG1 n=1 Tax=Thyridium curvatum TaxID=1093900 RepID=A0A507AVW4_9PEZI|nr:uncharacterized protein E0L32_010130 [Thyridium curvatum]TPX08400.1 hypothetical protein E0L32_010130 [Thyridium curvatum]